MEWNEWKLSCTYPTTKARDGEVGADVHVWRFFEIKMRVEKHEVGDRRMELGVQLGHHVWQVEMFARYYHL